MRFYLHVAVSMLSSSAWSAARAGDAGRPCGKHDRGKRPRTPHDSAHLPALNVLLLQSHCLIFHYS